MENYYLPEINHIGQKYVENWLAENGYFEINKELLQANEYGFVAKGKIENIMVQVRTFLHPQSLYKLSNFEIDALSAKASKTGMVAYAAYVTIDKADVIIGEITWERLN